MVGSKVFNKILIIDDDSDSVFLTTCCLEDMDITRQILTASNGKDGLAKVKQHCIDKPGPMNECPDLILLDINMPVMNGFEMLEELNSVGQSDLIKAKIVVLTTSSNKKDIEKMNSLGVKNYLEKPLTEDKLLSLIH